MTLQWKHMLALVLVLANCFLAYLGYQYFYQLKSSVSKSENQTRPRPLEKFNFNLIPAGFVSGVSPCEDLFVGSAAQNFKMSSEYQNRSSAFIAKIQQVAAMHKEPIEGHSHQKEIEYRMLHYFASQPSSRRICETGFNLGHSSFNYLTASTSSRVYSFDLGNHHYSRPMSVYLNDIYGRINVTFGNSVETLPKFAANVGRGFRCDMILVDGGHIYNVARADIINFARLANLEDNVILFDDHPSAWSKSDGFGKSWDELVTAGVIRERMRCTFKHDTQRGFCIGQVIKPF